MAIGEKDTINWIMYLIFCSADFRAAFTLVH
jgi:hypothetical protein